MLLDRRRFLAVSVASAHLLAPRSGAAASDPAASTAAPAGTSASPVVLEARPAKVRLLPDPAPPTAVACFNGTVPGPLLRVRLGETVRAGLVNGLAQSTALHWHGVRIANAMDGAVGLTQDAVPPQGRFDYRFTPPDAGIYWYHPILSPDAVDQVRRGLYGVLIVEEPDPPPVEADVLVVVRDWMLDADQQVASGAADANSPPPLVTVNAEAAPSRIDAAPGARLRLRIVNVGVSNIMVLGVRGARPLIFAIDGQPCPAFEPARQTFPIGPGARFELVVDMPDTAGGGVRLVLKAGAGERDLLVMNVRGEARGRHERFAAPASNGKLPEAIELQNAKRFDLVIGGPSVGKADGGNNSGAQTQAAVWSLNGVSATALPRSPAFSVKRGTPVVLGLVNKTAVVQAIHLHGHVMRQLHDLDDGWDPYWRDSVIVEPGKTHHVAFVADNPGKWLIASAMADRAAAGLSTWFAVS